MKIVKFGGKSLANGEGINTVLDILRGKLNKKKSYSSFSERKRYR
jgi:aspartokinase